MSITYYVALPFIPGEEGPMPGEAKDCLTESMAIRLAEGLSRKPENVGALAFKRTGTPSAGHFDDAIILKKFGEVPGRLDEL